MQPLPMSLEPGQSIAHYRVAEKIGEGGMGEVYRAEDTKLGRSVALKVLPEAFARDADRMARFSREAQVLASLNHPAIGAIYGLEEAGDTRCLVLELVQGPTLAERIAAGPMPLEEAFRVARQIAQGLEAAHERGVIHRDLKPANIKLTPQGTVKILDFGLAKAMIGDIGSGEASMSPTLTAAATRHGVIMGTAAYMSPEQARGQTADRRADIWAFGVVLHEMLTGRRLFGTETVSETLAAVLRDPVSMDALPAAIPHAVRSLLERCLDRDPGTRLRDIGEARIALSREGLERDKAATGPATHGVRPAAAGGARLLPWALVLVLGIMTAASLWRGSGAPVSPGGLLSLVAPIAENLRLPADQEGILALSPDGRTLALTLESEDGKMLYVRALAGAELVPMPGTRDASTPFFSPDSRWIAFFADNRLKKVPVSGGAPVTLCAAVGSNRGADWGDGDVIVFSPHYTQPLLSVSGAGGEPTALTAIDKSKGERTHRWPQVVPGEDLVLFTVGTLDSPESYDDARIEAIRPSSGERRTVLERASMARYLASGHLVFAREGFLFAVPFDVKSLEVKGSPVPVLENVMGIRSSGVSHFGFAENGLLAYLAGAPQMRRSRMVWRDRDGRTEPLPAPVANYLNPSISPDRTRIAVQVEGTSNFDISMYHIAPQTLTRLTFEGDNAAPVWSADGRRIAFASVRENAVPSVYAKAADGSGQASLVFAGQRLENAGGVWPYGWTPGGESLIVMFSNENSENIAEVPEQDGELRVLLDTPATETQPALSPDGRWLAYTSDDSGEYQIFVQAYPGPGGKWQASIAGGSSPRWSVDGRELFFRWQNDLYVVPISDASGSFSAGRPERLFGGLPTPGPNYDYDVLDRDRFLVIESAGDQTPPEGVTVLVNWLDDLKIRVTFP